MDWRFAIMIEQPAKGFGNSGGSGDDRERFKRESEAKIRAKLPPTGDFNRLVSKEISDFGDNAIIQHELEGAYNTPLDDAYVKILKSVNPVLVYHQYVAYPEHGAELAATFRDFNLPYTFEVSTRASTVKWDESWERPPEKEITLEKTKNGLIGRTVEYAMAFPLRDVNDADAMLLIIDNRFTRKTGQYSESNSWDIPDVRVTNIEKAHGAEAVFSNHFLEDCIIILAKEPILGVEYKRRMLVNKLLSEVIN